MFKLRLRRSTLAVVLLPIWAAVATAQTTAGLNGSITDATGAVIANARVTVTNADTGIQREAASDASGLYDIRLLQPGTYNIALQKEGFRQITRENVRLEVNQVAR